MSLTVGDPTWTSRWRPLKSLFFRLWFLLHTKHGGVPGGGVVGMTQLTSGEPGLFKPFGWCFKLIQSNDSYTMQSYIMD